jgi:hypothetical protein
VPHLAFCRWLAADSTSRGRAIQDGNGDGVVTFAGRKNLCIALYCLNISSDSPVNKSTVTQRIIYNSMVYSECVCLPPESSGDWPMEFLVKHRNKIPLKRLRLAMVLCRSREESMYESSRSTVY